VLSLEEVILEHEQLSSAPLFSRAGSCGSLQSGYLNRPKSVLLKSRLVLLLFAWFPPLRNLNSINSQNHRITE